jgi:general secretion pathway protein L
MSRVIGVDLRKSTVRLAVVRSGFRALEVEAFVEASLQEFETVGEALKHAFAQLGDKGSRVDTVVAAIPGGQAFLVPLSFPGSAERRLEELIPFELEAELPIDVDELTFGYQVLDRKRGRGVESGFSCLVACARRDHVEGVIQVVRQGLGHEPERIGVSSLELAALTHLWPGMGVGEPAVLVDVGEDSTDICVVEAGLVRMARTLNLGYGHFPAQSAHFAAQLRQTLSAYSAQSSGRGPETLTLVGEGAALEGLQEMLGTSLEVRVLRLGAESALTGSLSKLSSEAQGRVGDFARALGAALHGAKGRGYDLRRGALAYARGYGYIKERAPLLFALGVTILLSFLFATWAESRALEREHELLMETLRNATSATFGESTDNPDEARTMIDRFLKANPDDPMPYMDGFGVAVALSEAVPLEIVHDVEQFEYTKNKLKIRGLVSTTDEAQQVAKGLEEDPCIHDAKITKITQVVNSERARYMLEADIRCPLDRRPEEAKKKTTVAAP